MTDSNFTWTVLIAVVIFGALYVDPVSTSRVQMFECEGAVEEGRCKGRIKKAGRVKFTINPDARGVAMLVLDGQGALHLHGVIYPNCTVIDAGNWECRPSESSRLGMVDGYYTSVYSGGLTSAQTVGVSGWRHWASWAGMDVKPDWRVVL